ESFGPGRKEQPDPLDLQPEQPQGLYPCPTSEQVQNRALRGMFRGREDAIEVGMRKCGGLSYLHVAHGMSEAEK
ncbi:hypothetical protein U0070_002445, partial [Myodes glareolus]